MWKKLKASYGTKIENNNNDAQTQLESNNSSQNIKSFLYTIAEAKEFNDTELLKILKKSWGTPEDMEIKAIGEVANFTKSRKITNKLINIRNLEGIHIDYPLIDLDKNKYIKEDGVRLNTNNNLQSSHKYITFTLVLVSEKQRLDSNNPMKVAIKESSIRFLDKIPHTNKLNAISIEDDFFIETSTVEYIIEKQQGDIKKELNLFEAKKEELKVLEHDIQNKMNSVQKIFTREKEGLNKELESIEKEKEETKKSIDKLNQSRNIIINDIKTKKEDVATLVQSIEELHMQLAEGEELMSKKLEKLRAYIKNKADNLLDLEFIDQEEYDKLLMINNNQETDEKFVDFENDLDGDKQKAISHIQAYLFEQDIVYPRYILEDFFALIQTNDLIVLAGESGSGKTNLIKSFAEAIGGKFEIIPVKPNWTSSEDLLGYYNPLEKKYLSTPFLEALLEAKDNPDIPYFICLDEMNLARVEYYFADFLSLLEERGEQPEIKLYSEDESSHILSEFKNVMDTIEYTKEKYKKKNIVNFVKLLQDEEINRELTKIFGFSDKDSLIKYHTDLRRMLSGILNTPSSIVFPKNVRIIGAINIDETTHYLSPKILDRAHIMKFDSPLLQDWTKIANEIEDIENKELKIKIDIEDLGTREPYPSFDREDEFCKAIINMTKEYFSPLGVEVGLRTIRQGLNYQKIFIEQGSNKELVINNFIIHKILPKMTFDGKKKVGEITKNDLLLQFKENLKEYIDQDLAKLQSIDTIDELQEIIKISESNDGIVNYWA